MQSLIRRSSLATQGRRRALGQHFLKDQAIAQMIGDTALEEASKHACSALLEIGPGRGAITLPILESLQLHPGIQKFILAERDPKIAAYWKEYQTKMPFRVELNDFLDLPEENWLGDVPLTVVSN